MRAPLASALMPDVLLWLALTVAAQDASRSQGQEPTFRGRVDLVQVDVVAVDQDGNPVLGLKAADFTLLDRKKPQTILSRRTGRLRMLGVWVGRYFFPVRLLHPRLRAGSSRRTQHPARRNLRPSRPPQVTAHGHLFPGQPTLLVVK